MKRISFIILLLGLSACAQQPFGVNPACPLSGYPDAVLLTVSRDNNDSREQMILHTQMRGDGLEGVALNPVGARLFSSSIRGGVIEIENAPFYRGADAATLIWAYSLWQQRDQAQICWPNSSSQTVIQESNGKVLLRDGKRTLAIWHPQLPGMIELPHAKLRLDVRVMD